MNNLKFIFSILYIIIICTLNSCVQSKSEAIEFYDIFANPDEPLISHSGNYEVTIERFDDNYSVKSY